MANKKIIKKKPEVKTSKNNSTAVLINPEVIAEAMYESLMDGDSEAFLEIVAAHLEAVNLSHLADSSGVALRTIHNALSAKRANPRIATIAKLMHNARKLQLLKRGKSMRK